MAAVARFPIGTPGQKWGDAERTQWRESRALQRSYQEEVVTPLLALKNRFTIAQYGSLSQDAARYPLYYAKTLKWKEGRPCVLVTGGVHGYETSGVQGALLFLATKAESYSETFNILVAPCVSPWGYETIQRWNYHAVDPNRSFNPDGEVVEGRSFNPEAATEESSALIALLASQGVAQWCCHIDCHETTDSDATEFRPAKAARDGEANTPDDEIPDGFYLVADMNKDQPEFLTAMIEAVRAVTHIAPADKDGMIIGEKVVKEGVIAIPSPKSLGLCAGVTNATYACTTEVYPDSPRPSCTADNCNQAQVACIEGALQHIRAQPVA